jgi:Spy/CpxP family protein refolding chaperone
MKKMPLMAMVAALAAAIAPDLWSAPKSAQATLLEQQDLMIRECKLPEEQQQTLKEKFKLKQEALAAWEKENGEKLRTAEEAAKAARKGADEAAKKKAISDLKELEAKRSQATAEADKAIQEVLSAEQKLTWASVQLAQTTLARYKRANLTDEQTAKVKSACQIATQDLAAVAGEDRKAKQARATVQKSLKWAIDNVILTPEQRSVVTRPAKQ